MYEDKLQDHLCGWCLSQYDIAIATGLLMADGDSPARCLLQLELVHLSSDNTYYVPVRPSTAAARLLGNLRDEIRACEDRVAELASLYDVAEAVFDAAQRPRADSLLLEGPAITASLQASVEACRERLMTAQPGGGRPPTLLDRARERDIALLRRGVRQRTLYQHTVRRHEPTVDYVRHIIAAGAEVRTLDHILDRLIICDESVAYVPTGPRRANQALEIRDRAIVRFLIRVFDNEWMRAKPMSDDGESRVHSDIVSDLHLSIMRRLTAGYTDAKIARDLGMSPRTVAEHVARISKQLGSTSRAHLGYLIALSGLLDPDHDREVPAH